jgi:uncharacterized protein involved in exopolysaccharide biosynthesis
LTIPSSSPPLVPASGPPPASTSLARGYPGEDVTIFGGLSALLARWRLVVGLPVLSVTLSLLVSLVVPPGYTATTTFVPEVRSPSRLPTGIAGIAGIAGQLGLSFGAEPSQSPRFYAEILRSRELEERVLATRYPDPDPRPGARDSIRLLDVLRPGGRSAADSMARAVKKLARLIAVTSDNQTTIVRLSVTLRSAELAAAVANRFVAYLNEFNTLQRQSQARERREFTERRVAAADSELRRAEEAVKTFYERNRGWQQAPELVFQEGRLRRQVEVAQEVFLTLKREYETARIEEVNDTPVITVIDPAAVPQERSRPRRLLFALLGFLLGATVAVFWALAAEYADRVRRAQVDEYVELRSRMQRASREVRQMFSRIISRA